MGDHPSEGCWINLNRDIPQAIAQLHITNDASTVLLVNECKQSCCPYLIHPVYNSNVPLSAITVSIRLVFTPQIQCVSLFNIIVQLGVVSTGSKKLSWLGAVCRMCAHDMIWSRCFRYHARQPCPKIEPSPWAIHCSAFRKRLPSWNWSWIIVQFHQHIIRIKEDTVADKQLYNGWGDPGSQSAICLPYSSRSIKLCSNDPYQQTNLIAEAWFIISPGAALVLSHDDNYQPPTHQLMRLCS